MDIKTQIKRAIAARVPVLLMGDTGIGKTAQIAQLAAELDAHLETVLASIRGPEDFGGLPLQDGQGGVTLAPPAWARRLAEKCAGGKLGILFLDEVTSTPPATQGALLRVVHERVVGELALPASVVVIAAGNPDDVAAGGWDLGAALDLRFEQLIFPCPSPDAWAAWMLGQESIHPKARALAAGFVRARPALLDELGAARDRKARAAVLARKPHAFGCPRKHEHAARLIAACIEAGDALPDALPLIAGAIGEPAAIEYCAWLRSADLPDPETLLADPVLFAPDAKRPDITFAILASVAEAASTKGSRSERDYAVRWASAVPVFERGLAAGKECVLLPARRWAAADRRPKGALPPAVIAFINKIKAVVQAAGIMG